MECDRGCNIRDQGKCFPDIKYKVAPENGMECDRGCNVRDQGRCFPDIKYKVAPENGMECDRGCNIRDQGKCFPDINIKWPLKMEWNVIEGAMSEIRVDVSQI